MTAILNVHLWCDSCDVEWTTYRDSARIVNMQADYHAERNPGHHVYAGPRPPKPLEIKYVEVYPYELPAFIWIGKR